LRMHPLGSLLPLWLMPRILLYGNNVTISIRPVNSSYAPLIDANGAIRLWVNSQYCKSPLRETCGLIWWQFSPITAKSCGDPAHLLCISWLREAYTLGPSRCPIFHTICKHTNEPGCGVRTHFVL
jgi:hypothetical protein